MADLDDSADYAFMANGAASNRDNFSSVVKRQLAERVNYRCSVCDAHTIGPREGSDKSHGPGRAAHIKAASPKGPRYDETQTSEERASFNNGLWACANCADIIDGNAAAYSVQQLQLIKAQAERLAATRVGKVPTTDTFRPTLRSITRNIQAFCLAEADRYEAMDDRFDVKVAWSGDHPVYQLRANQPVTGKLVFGGGPDPERIEALRDVLAYGGTHTFEDVDLRLEGSPIFADGETGGCLTLRISSTVEERMVTVALGATEDTALYIEVAGEISAGQQGVRFRGSGVGGLVKCVFR